MGARTWRRRLATDIARTCTDVVPRNRHRVCASTPALFVSALYDDAIDAGCHVQFIRDRRRQNPRRVCAATWHFGQGRVGDQQIFSANAIVNEIRIV
jgi:hypothetical protein